MVDPDLSAVGALLSEPARARILLALIDGRALPASMLASEAGIANSTASEHLRRLTEGGLLAVSAHGRYRYYRLAGPHVAELLEIIARLAPEQRVTSLREGTRASALRRARRCYDHLAGQLGVAVASAFLDLGYLMGDLPGGFLEPAAFALTPAGVDALRALGAEPPASRAVRGCVDWTEQRHHMAGPAGRALLGSLERLGWVRSGRYPRVLILTEAGRAGLAGRFGVVVDADRSAPDLIGAHRA